MMDSPTDKYRLIRSILVKILVLNLIVSFAKIGYGSFTNTLSMESDGYHSLFDGISNIIGILGIQIASKPPDRSHPYGHQKYESLASVFIAVLLFIVAVEIISKSVERFISPSTPEITFLSFVVMILTIAVNLFVTIYEKREGDKLKSDILIADSMHTRSDIYVSISVIAGLLAVKGGYLLIDPIIAVIISLFIIRAAINIIKSSSKTLCDESRIDEDIICNIAFEVDGVMECHRIRTRGTKGEYYIDLHIEVDPKMPVDQAHAISHQVSDQIKQYMEDVKDVVVHTEPHEKQD
ncbi:MULTISPECIES: cation diffusion facilitator family transporter [Methanohalophilus]|jgi:cation diffusion facilitator family transporter|uniref:Cation diffusion facilitator family transporter n=1 Tax=Methanohalophilus euhalobius TaxID=51203 RepID=A0A315A2A0_9EURY|nr:MULTISPECIES: cation diffusion facilitator family transporter [Methanohalophilus]KXS41123.1 MAG: cation diffusion facilitator family transporter [Methanohalophilus sp. T328-1]PQV43714.1 cation diffusion facilitator family transporter [Methanohalophilus euhalobius]RNI12706.1 cation transporter [Methanohalophilus euhalobius]RXG34643.1 cation diffusion facilitator family transporter [Methanohalophilus sp. WG1-DM]